MSKIVNINSIKQLNNLVVDFQYFLKHGAPVAMNLLNYEGETTPEVTQTALPILARLEEMEQDLKTVITVLTDHVK